MDLIGQSLAWPEKSGLPPMLVQQMLSGFFGNPATREYVTKITERDFDNVGFTAAGGLKDVSLMIDAAQGVNLRLSSAEALRAKLDMAVARGWQDKDWSCFTDIDRAWAPTSGTLGDRTMSLSPFVPTPKIEDYRERFRMLVLALRAWSSARAFMERP